MTVRLQIEAELQTQVATFLSVELPLSGQAVVGNHSHTKVVAGTSRKRYAQFGRGAHPPSCGRIGLEEHAPDGPYLTREEVSGAAVVIQTDRPTWSRQTELVGQHIARTTGESPDSFYVTGPGSECLTGPIHSVSGKAGTIFVAEVTALVIQLES